MPAGTDPEPDLSEAYANTARIPGGEDYPARWATAAAAFRARTGARAETGIPWGEGPRRCFDLFHPEGAPQGLMVFLHGGYWLRFDPSFWSHLAAGALARGWAVAIPGYTLAPEARISAITREAARGIAAAAARVPGPLVLTGHSAGGHLAARMACAELAPPFAGRLKRVVPISPLADLRPLLRTAMNDSLRLDALEAAAESPALRRRRAGVDCTVWVGGQERPAFLWQARLLSEVWDCPWHVAAGRHHFDVIDDLADPDSRLMQVLLA